MTEYPWHHEEIAALLSRISIKTCDGFSEKDPSWICPGCARSKRQIIAPGPNVDIVACVYRHHDDIEDLIARLLDRELPKPLSRHEILARRLLRAVLKRRFCRFKAVDVCHACNNVDTAAKKISARRVVLILAARHQERDPAARAVRQPPRDRPRSTTRCVG